MEEPLVSVIIPTYKRERSLIRTLKSIERSSYKNLEIIVVDMGGSHQLEKTIKEELRGFSKKIKIVKGHEEMYVSGAMNEGIKHAKGKYIMICADDVVLEEDTIQELVDVLLKHEDIGIIAPVVYYLKDPKRIWWAGSKVNMWTSRTYFYGRDLPLPDSEIFDTDSFTTVALIRRNLFYDEDGKLLFVDEKEFPMHNEEADFSFRAKKSGWKVCVAKNAKAYHDVPPPEDVKDLARLHHVHTEKRAYLAARNRILFQKKYSNRLQFLVFILIFNWLFTLYYLIVIMFGSRRPTKEKISIAKSYLKGIVSGLRWI